mmetsp:Transcript_8234/g.9417  ORF Transcript_8234/g.9417 Transcript_8234/m.9417 type:complete len:316 (-) Transcript_8234:126-1073(-)
MIGVSTFKLLLFCTLLVAVKINKTYGFCDNLKKPELGFFRPWLVVVRKANSTSREDGKRFKNVIEPLATMTKISYTGNLTEEVPGWSLIFSLTPRNGLNALAFKKKGSYNEYGNGIIITFRGTTTTSDRCADAILWDPEDPIPFWCRVFRKSTLDYISQALKFVKQVKAGYPNHPIMFTGHSLGAALAEMMSLNSSGESPSLCFASAGAKGPARRAGLFNSQSDVSCLFQIDNPWDPIVSYAMKDQLGYLCEFQNVSETEACRRCLKEGKLSILCEQCFQDAHKFINYLNLVNRGQAPVCTFRPTNVNLRTRSIE